MVLSKEHFARPSVNISDVVSSTYATKSYVPKTRQDVPINRKDRLSMGRVVRNAFKVPEQAAGLHTPKPVRGRQ